MLPLEPSLVSAFDVSPLLGERMRAFPEYFSDPQEKLWRIGRPMLCPERGATAPIRIGIVGTRRPSAYGLSAVQKIIAAIAETNASVVVVSGGALGIDGEAHDMALKFGLPTQAIVVGPIRSPSPRTHASLFSRIASGPRGSGIFVPDSLEVGAEAATGAKWRWIKRNLYIAAACHAVVVVEAQIPSGTFSTVKAALNMGICTYAFPGPVGAPSSEGTNLMIAMGYAHPVVEVKKLIRDFLVAPATAPYNKL